MATLADAAVEIIAELDRFEPDLRRKLTAAVQSAADAAEREFRRAGDKAGKAFADATAKAAGVTASDSRFERAGAIAGSQFASGFGRDTNRLLARNTAAFTRAGQEAGTRYGQSVRATARQAAGRAGDEAGNFFSRAFESAAGRAIGTGLFTALAAGAATAVTAATPLSTVLGGAAAAAVALAAALAQAAGAGLALGGVLGSLGLAAAAVQVGTQGLSEAWKAQTKALEELRTEGQVSAKTQADLADALANLSPNAAATVRQLAAMAPAWERIRRVVQDNLFANVAPAIQQLGARFLPDLQTALGAAAARLNATGVALARFLTAPPQARAISAIFDSLNRILGRLLPAVQPLAAGFLTLFRASLPFAERLATVLGSYGPTFAAFAASVTSSGAFSTFLENAFTAAQQLLGVLGNLGSIIGSIFSAGSQAGVTLLATLENLTGELAEFLASAQGQTALASFFALIGTSVNILVAAFRTLEPLLSGITVLFQALQGPLQALGTALIPVIGQLATTLGNAFRALAPSVAALITGLTPLVTTILTTAVTVFQQLLTALLPLAPVFVQLVTAIAAGIIPVIQQLVPIITPVVTAFTQILTALLPLVPTLLTLIPPLAQLSVALAQILVALTPLATELTPLFVQAIQQLTPVIVALTPVIAGLIGSLTGLAGILASLVGGFVQFASTALSAFERFRAGALRALVGFQSGGAAAIAGFVSRAAGLVAGWVGTILGNLGRFASSAIGVIRGFVSGAIGALRGLIGPAIGAVQAVVSGIRGALTGGLAGLAGVLAAAGRSAIDGLVGGLASGLGRVRSIASQIASTVSGAVSNILKIGSPSRVMADQGRDTVQGFINGIREKLPAVRAALANLASAVPSQVEAAVRQVNTSLNQLGRFLTSGQRARLNAIVSSARTSIAVIERASDALDAKLKASQENLVGLLRQAQQFASQIASNIVQTGNVAQGQDQTFGGIVTRLKEAVANAKQFRIVLANLAKAGLNKTALEQLAEAGPTAGLAAGEAILAAGRAGIRQVNTLQAQLQKEANRAATQAATALFGQGIQVARGIVAGFQRQRRALDTQMTRLADVLVSRILRILRNVRVGKNGRLIELPGFSHGGLATRPSLVGEDYKPEVVIPLTKPQRRDELLERYFSGWANQRAWNGGRGYGAPAEPGPVSSRTKEVHVPIYANGASAEEVIRLIEEKTGVKFTSRLGIRTSVGER